MDSTPFSAKIDDTAIILTVSKHFISANAKADDELIFDIAPSDLILCNNQANHVILNWNSGNTVSSAILSSRHAREIVSTIQSLF